MEAQKSKKRELIKTIAIVFLAVLLVLTFFSNTIMNRSLPEVATGIVNSGTINAKIRGSGTISANESYEVVLNQTREVRSVCVKVGDTVNQGDLLFVLGDIESQELRDAEEQLSTLQINYQKQVLELSKTYAQNDRSLQVIREDLEKAIARRDANKVTDADISYKKGDLATAKNEVAQLSLILEELNALIADNGEYQAAQAAVTEWSGKVDAAQKKVEEIKAKLAEAGSTSDINQLKRDMEAKAAAMETARDELTTAELALTEALKNSVYLEIEAKAKQAMIDAGVDITDPAKLEAYIQNVIAEAADDTKTKYQNAYNSVSAAKNAYNTATTKYNGAVSAYNTAKELYESASSGNNVITTLTQQLNAAQNELNAANYQLQMANAALTQAENSNKAVKEQIKGYEATKRQQDALVTTLTDELAAMEAQKTIYDEAVTTVETKERELADALSGKDIDKQLNDLNLQATRLQIDKQKELVAKYREEAISTEITANVSGTVSAINVSAGKETTAGSPMAVIDVVDRGYTIKIPVTNEQAKQVKVGDTADVSNYYWGNDITATLESITSDPEKPGQGKLLIFRITGEIDAGTTLSLSIGQRSANYDSIIPKSALREDTNGHFVLVVTAKSSPLGNRYVATRVDVQVLAEDDTNAAVSGLAQGDYVITTSSKPLEAGTLVRLVENA